MKLHLLPILIFCGAFASNQANAQCPDTLKLVRQSQVDSFFLLYPNCTKANNILISGEDIQNLHGLLGLNSVGRDLVIKKNPQLKSLAGLDSLKEIGWYFIIESNDNLESLDGLTSLKDAGSYVRIIFNPRIKDLKGLAQCEEAHNVTIQRNDSLISLEGFQNVKNKLSLGIIGNTQLTSLLGLEMKEFFSLQISGTRIIHANELSGMIAANSIYLTSNPLLTRLPDLPNLKTIKEKLEISNNQKLISLEGLDSLQQVGSLIIEENESLVDLHGLEQLKLISGAGWPFSSKLTIFNNDKLQSITDLESLILVDGPINIWSNNELSECVNLFFCQSILTNNSFFFTLNGPGCKSKEDLLTACGINYNYIRGSVYLDFECNQVLDTNDIPLPGIFINSLETNTPIILTKPTGDYFNLVVGDTLLFGPGNLTHFESFPSSYEIIADSMHFIYDSLNFYLCPDTLFHDLAVSLTNFGPPRPGFDLRYQACVRNLGMYPEDAILVLDFSGFPASQYITVDHVPGGTINGQTITWNIADIAQLDNECLSAYIHISANAPLGIKITPHLYVTSAQAITEIDLANNEVFESSLLVGSYDPNDKTSFISREWVDDGKATIEYQIRFQNTGTYHATFVEITDTLEADLDIKTFEMIAASHPYTVSFPDTNIIKWRFDDINLPDSSANELSSHGFVRFRIDSRENKHSSTVIKNKASIYFDFNSPVVTNTTSVFFDFQTNTAEPELKTKPLSIVPNPTNGQFQIGFDEEVMNPVLLEILDLNGRVIKRMEKTDLLGGRMIEVNMNTFQSGVYFIRFLSKENIYSGRVILVRE